VLYRYASGARYEGLWKDNAKHGRGVYHYADGGKFEGEFVNGSRGGIGVRTWPDGTAKVRFSRQPCVILYLQTACVRPVATHVI
jgi:hypothetical protein